MALKPCRECGAEISTTAKHCPQCGAPSKAQAVQSAGMSMIGAGCALMIALPLLILFFLLIL